MFRIDMKDGWYVMAENASCRDGAAGGTGGERHYVVWRYGPRRRDVLHLGSGATPDEALAAARHYCGRRHGGHLFGLTGSQVGVGRDEA